MAYGGRLYRPTQTENGTPEGLGAPPGLPSGGVGDREFPTRCLVRYAKLSEPALLPSAKTLLVSARPKSPRRAQVFAADPLQNESRTKVRYDWGSTFSCTRKLAETLRTRSRRSQYGRYGIFGRGRVGHSSLMLAARITLAHFSVSSAEELAEIGRRTRQQRAAEIDQPCLQRRIVESSVDFSIEPVDDRSRRLLGCTQAK